MPARPALLTRGMPPTSPPVRRSGTICATLFSRYIHISLWFRRLPVSESLVSAWALIPRGVGLCRHARNPHSKNNIPGYFLSTAFTNAVTTGPHRVVYSPLLSHPVADWRALGFVAAKPGLQGTAIRALPSGTRQPTHPPTHPLAVLCPNWGCRAPPSGGWRRPTTFPVSRS